MTSTRWIALALACAISLPAAAAGDATAGQAKASTCMGCHGIPGYNNVYPTYRVPKIGGQSPEYIAAALKEYRAGERQHPTMQAQGGSMSDADIADIAAFLATAPQHPGDMK